MVRAFSGIITWEVILCSAVSLAGSMLGNLVGKYVFDKLNTQRLRQIVYIGMIISGVIMAL